MVKDIKRGDIIMVDNSSYKEPHGNLIYVLNIKLFNAKFLTLFDVKSI